MTSRIVSRPIAVLTAALILGTTSCERDVSTLGPAPLPTDSEVFLDEFGPGVDYAAFSGSKVTALDISFAVTYQGSRSLQFTIPNFGDPEGSFAGGAFTSSGERNLSGYNALEFWARSSMTATLGVAGIGNDNTGNSLYGAQVTDLPLTTIWERYVIPIPLPEKLSVERGLFEVASGPEEDAGYELWLDEVQFVNDPTITNPRPAIATQNVTTTVGSTVKVEGTTVTYNVGGREVLVQASPYYFTFGSSDASVATVAADGTITAVGTGTATITATLGSANADGAVTVTVGTIEVPTNAAPTPTVPAGQVISLFSNAYTDVVVDTWSADFDTADLEDVQIEGDDTKRYSNLGFAAIEFTSEPIDVTSMTHFHMDVWTFDSSEFKIKLVDFGPDGEFGGGDDSEHEVTLNENTVPAMTTGAWSVLDVPLSDFVGLTGRTNLAQLILSGASPTIYVDNVYFYSGDGGGGTEPNVAAPTPTLPEADVVSMFSNAYTDVPVDTWSAVWDDADVADVQVAGDDTKLYTNLVFAGIEATSQPIDASAMTGFHMDIWTPDPTAAPAIFKIKLVDFGPDGAFGGGDDSEHEITLDDTTTPAMATGEWASLDIPLADFTGLTGTGAIAQMILSGDPNTVYVDNVYFYRTGGGGGGTGGDGATGGPFAVSFDDPGIAYTLTDFGGTSSALEPDPADAGNTVARTTKLVTAMTWAGTTVGGVNITYPFSATETQISMRVRSPDAGIPVRMKVETAGDPTRSVETEAVTTVANAWETLTFDFANEAPGTAPLNPAYTYDMLSVFFNFDTDGATAGEKTYYWDTIEFLGTGGGGGTEPGVAAPTPTVPEADVVSMFSNAYTDVFVDTWSAVWDAADVADIQVAGDDTKLYTNLVFAGIEATTQPIDASAMTAFHMDMWTPDATAPPAVFKIKLVDFGADGAFGGGDDSEHELTFDATTTPALATGEWVSLGLPLTDFTGLTGTGAIAQMILSGDPNTVYVDNVYFYR